MNNKTKKSLLEFMENFNIFEDNSKKNKITQFRQIRYRRNRVWGVV